MRNLNLKAIDVKRYLKDEFGIKANQVSVKVVHDVDTEIIVKRTDDSLNKQALQALLSVYYDYQRYDATGMELGGGNQFVSVY